MWWCAADHAAARTAQREAVLNEVLRVASALLPRVGAVAATHSVKVTTSDEKKSQGSTLSPVESKKPVALAEDGRQTPPLRWRSR